MPKRPTWEWHSQLVTSAIVGAKLRSCLPYTYIYTYKQNTVHIGLASRMTFYMCRANTYLTQAIRRYIVGRRDTK